MKLVAASLLSFLGFLAPAAAADKKAAKAGIDMEAIFKKIDANKDGALSKDEFAKLADEIREKGDKAAKIADRIKASANELFARLDADKNGAISLEEAKKFEISMLRGEGKAAAGDPEATFKKLDQNKDGKLSKDEFAKLADEFKPADPNKAAKAVEKIKSRIGEMFARLDENKDDALSLDEFKKFTGLKGAKKEKQAAAERLMFVVAKANKAAKNANKKAAKKTNKKAAKKANKKVGDLDALFKKLDADNDKKLSKDEFAKIADEQKKKKAANAKKAGKAKTLIDAVFTKLDENKDGSLSLAEFKKYTGLKGEKKKKKKAK